MKLNELKQKDPRYTLLSFKQICIAELAKFRWQNGAFLTYSDIEKVFNGKHNIQRCIEKLTFFKIIKPVQGHRVFEYIPLEDVKEDKQTTLLRLIENGD